MEWWMWVVVGYVTSGLFVTIGIVRNWTSIVENGDKSLVRHNQPESECDVCNAKK